MIRFLLPALLGAIAGAGEAGDLCASDDPRLLFAACETAPATVDLLLLPEETAPTPAGALDVTGGYTATDRRKGDAPKPVGLFVRGGEIVSREYVRFDGVLTVSAEGAARIHHRRRVRFAATDYDLEDAAARDRFLSAASAAGADVLQSHLLVADGVVDTRPVEGAPAFRRRILFLTANGDLGVYDSGSEPLTLDESARDVTARFAPAMALNLDMGSYDFCRMGERLCGALGQAQMAKLSNLLRFSGGSVAED